MRIRFLQAYRGVLTDEQPYQQGEHGDFPQAAALRIIAEGAATTLDDLEETPDPPAPVLPYQPLPTTPAAHRVVAVMSSYNDADVIAWVIRRALAQGIELVVIDNWSTDATYELASQFRGERGFLDLLRFPAHGPTRRYDFHAFIRFFMQVLHERAHDAWHMWHASDESVIAPWRGIPYRDALWLVQQEGYTCVDHHYLDFWPTSNLAPFVPGDDVVQRLLWFELRNPMLQRAWRAPVYDIWNMGHEVWFAGKRVYPTRFILKNYRYRSQAHADRKRYDRSTRLPQYRAGVQHCSSYFRERFDVVKDPDGLSLWRDAHWIADSR